MDITLVIILSLVVLFILGFHLFVLNMKVPPGQIVVLKRSGHMLKRNHNFPGIALNPKELGILPDIYLPGERIIKYPKWQYEHIEHAVTIVPEGEIGLVVSKFGQPRQQGKKLSISVDCKNYQNAAAFFQNGGQMGTQSNYLNEGKYYINLEIFRVITSENIQAEKDRITKKDLKPIIINKDKIGIVTTEDGEPLEGQIAGARVKGHYKFTNATAFLANGGYRGLQEEILSSGSWFINPWFAKIEVAPLTEIPNDRVGVLISSFGKIAANHSEAHSIIKQERASVNYYGEIKKMFEEDDIKHAYEKLRDLIDESYSQKDYEKLRSLLVDEGFKGVLKRTLDSGRHAINTEIYKVETVPTNQIILQWHDREKKEDRWDYELGAIPIFTKDRHKLKLEVTQVIRISKDEAPIMVLTVGSQNSGKVKGNQTSAQAIKNLVTKVLSSTIENEFVAAASANNGIDFIDETRSEIQAAITAKVSAALKFHGVIGINTTFTVVELSKDLQKLLDKKNEIETNQKLTEVELRSEKLIEEQRLQQKKELEEAHRALVRAELESKKELEEQKLQQEKELEEQRIKQERQIEEQKLLKSKELKEKEIQTTKELEEANRALVRAELESKKELEEQRLQQEKELEEANRALAKVQLESKKELEEQRIQQEQELKEKALKSEQSLEIVNREVSLTKLETEYLNKVIREQKEKELLQIIDENTMSQLINELERDLLKSEKGVRIKELLTQQKSIETELELNNFIRKLKAEGGPEAQIMMEYMRNFAKQKVVPNFVIGNQGDGSNYLNNPASSMLWNIMRKLGNQIGSSSDIKSLGQEEIGQIENTGGIIGLPRGEQSDNHYSKPVQLDLIMDSDFEEFISSPEKLKELMLDVSNYLGDSKIDIINIQSGSVILTLKMEYKSAEKLFFLVKMGLLSSLEVININFPEMENEMKTCNDELLSINVENEAFNFLKLKSCLKQTLRKEDGIKKTFEQISTILLDDSKIQNVLIGIEKRYAQVKNDQMKGILNSRETLQEISLTIGKICDLIDSISETDIVKQNV